MTSRERVLSCLERTGYDRIPVKHEGTPEVNKMLVDHFGLTNHEQLLRVLGDDFRYVQPKYCGPELRTFPDGSFEGFWGERYAYKPYEGGQYVEPAFFAQRTSTGRIFRPQIGSITAMSGRSARRFTVSTLSASAPQAIWISLTRLGACAGCNRCSRT